MKNIEAAGNVVEKETQKETAMESETPKDREVEPGGYLTEETTKEKAVNNVVEENTQSNVSKKDYLYGLSSEAAAQIKTLKFNKNSKLNSGLLRVALLCHMMDEKYSILRNIR